MEKETIDIIIAEGQKLSEKKTWLAKGYNDLLAKINEHFAVIPDMDEGEIRFLLREYKYSPNIYEDWRRRIHVVLVFQNDAFVKLTISKENEYEWTKEDFEAPTETPTTETIREFATKLPEIMSTFLEEIQKRNKENREAINLIENLLKKLSA